MTGVSPIAALPAAQRVFDALSARLASRRDFKRIDRSYLTLGDVDFPLTCSQFVVSVRQITSGGIGSPGLSNLPGAITPHAGYKQYALELGIAYTDCWPLGDQVISDAKETKAALDMLERVDIVTAEVFAAYYAGELVDDCSATSIGPVTLVGPGGGVAGVTVLLTTQLV